MLRVIYAIYVNTGAVGVCLDAIRLLASPVAKRFSHLTVRGPYDGELGLDELTRLNELIEPNSIFIEGVGHFFEHGQNTVFFTCRGEVLQSIWDKVDYQVFLPHVTVYDGDDREYATSIYDVIKKYNYNVMCGDDRLEMFEIGNGSNGGLASQIRIGDVPQELGLGPEFPSEVSNMPAEQRLEIVDKLCKYLSLVSEPM